MSWWNPVVVLIDIYPSHVIIEGVRIDRPRRLSPAQWLHYWETVTMRRVPSE